MSPPSPIRIEALVDPAERPGMVAAAEQLSECLGAADDGRAWPVRLNFLSPGEGLGDGPPPSVVIASLLSEVARPDEPIAETEVRWRAYLERLQASGAPVLVRTVFRHLSGRPNAGAVSPLLVRIRRLNLMAAHLSHVLGVGVIDIDRAFAHIGGKVLQTDYRLGGVLAAEVAGHTTAWSLLSFGLDEAVEPGLQERAKSVLGGLQRIDALVGRRLSQRRAAQIAREQAGRG
jgi:hypothetical protein